MLGKIHKEMNNFTFNIKTIKGHDELLSYMNKNTYSSIKLLIFSSSTFSICGKMMLAFLITLSSLLVISSFGLFGDTINNSYLLFTTFVLYILTLAFVLHCNNYLSSSIVSSKKSKEKNEE